MVVSNALTSTGDVMNMATLKWTVLQGTEILTDTTITIPNMHSV